MSHEVGSREGIWWLPRDSVTDYLILTNFSNAALNAALTLYDPAGKASQQEITLSARETRRLSVRSLLHQAGLNGPYGGIQINTTKGSNYLDSVHVTFDEAGGFSALMKMFRHEPSVTLSSRVAGGGTEWITRAPMLALTHPDPALAFPAGTVLQPKVFLRNTSSKTYIAHVRFNWWSVTASGKTAPIDLAIQPNATQVIDVAGLQSQNLIPIDANWASVIISAAIQPDELMAVAASYDASSRFGAQTPFSDQLASHWEAGQWQVDGTHDSLVTIANGGSKPANAQLTIFYNHGKDQYQLEQTLAPDSQILMDFGKLIRNQIPGKDGRPYLPT